VLRDEHLAELRSDSVRIAHQPFVGDVQDDEALSRQAIASAQIILLRQTAQMMCPAVHLNNDTARPVHEINPSDEPGLVVNRNLPVRHGKTKEPQKLAGFECAFRRTTGVVAKK
jgi:hypothetical protein